MSRKTVTLPWCKWCIEGSGPVIQLKVGGVLHRWVWFKEKNSEEPWTLCGYRARARS